MGVKPENRWTNATYTAVRLLEEVPRPNTSHSHIYRSSFDIQEFPLCDRIELYCVAEPGNRALIIDTGHLDLCGTEALDGIHTRLAVPWDHTAVFLTHFHDDHDGNLLYCIEQGASHIFAGPTNLDDVALLEGFLLLSASPDLPRDMVRDYIHLIASGKKAQAETEHIRTSMYGGETVSLAGYDFEVLLTPGHTVNHVCLLEPTEKILFAGDHICDMPPGHLQFVPDQHLVREYLRSLAELKAMNLSAVYMCHHDPLIGASAINEFISMLESRYNSLVERTRAYFDDDDDLTVRKVAEKAAAHYPEGLAGFPVFVQVQRIATMFGTLEYLYDVGLLSRSFSDEGAFVYHRLW